MKSFFKRTLAALNRWMWRKFLMLLSALAWRLDEWVHAQQLQLRRDSGFVLTNPENEKRLLSPSAEKREHHDSRNSKARTAGRPHDAHRIAQFDQQAARSAGVAARDAQRLSPHRYHEAYAVSPIEFRSGSTHSEPAAEIPVAGYHHRQPESFDEWTKRRAGVAPASKAEARRHRERLTAAAFDRRFAS